MSGGSLGKPCPRCGLIGPAGFDRIDAACSNCPEYAPPGASPEFLAAQLVHERLMRVEPDHDRVGCVCCCLSEPCEPVEADG